MSQINTQQADNAFAFRVLVFEEVNKGFEFEIAIPLWEDFRIQDYVDSLNIGCQEVRFVRWFVEDRSDREDEF